MKCISRIDDYTGDGQDHVDFEEREKKQKLRSGIMSWAFVDAMECVCGPSAEFNLG